mmetsp:Transcript_22891/g.47489  ORF Transcript_22891/g.47489 Transcript_22891/m.47489 type:complete len:231 (-) Transcript_22891:30-722(-)
MDWDQDLLLLRLRLLRPPRGRPLLVGQLERRGRGQQLLLAQEAAVEVLGGLQGLLRLFRLLARLARRLFEEARHAALQMLLIAAEDALQILLIHGALLLHEAHEVLGGPERLKLFLLLLKAIHLLFGSLSAHLHLRPQDVDRPGQVARVDGSRLRRDAAHRFSDGTGSLRSAPGHLLNEVPLHLRTGLLHRLQYQLVSALLRLLVAIGPALDLEVVGRSELGRRAAEDVL